MVDLGLTYSQTKNPDGTYQYQIDPDINFLCNFKGKKPKIYLFFTISIDSLSNRFHMFIFFLFCFCSQSTIQ